MCNKRTFGLPLLMCCLKLIAGESLENKMKPASETLQELVPNTTPVYIPFKTFTARANQHLEFIMSGRLLVSVCQCPQVIVNDLVTDQLVTLDEQTQHLYADRQRTHEKRSKNWSTDTDKESRLRSIGLDVDQKRILIKTLMNKETDPLLPDTVAMSPDKELFAMGAEDPIFLYKKCDNANLATAHTSFSPVTRSTSSAVLHTKFCRMEEACKQTE